uniref:Uncharacterized protein n=1 Tax=mine drainage metagenome TaxID=410659 RepID=E6QQU4_9ZZZZ
MTHQTQRIIVLTQANTLSTLETKAVAIQVLSGNLLNGLMKTNPCKAEGVIFPASQPLVPKWHESDWQRQPLSWTLFVSCSIFFIPMFIQRWQ